MVEIKLEFSGLLKFFSKSVPMVLSGYKSRSYNNLHFTVK